jgi:hypothetical protein
MVVAKCCETRRIFWVDPEVQQHLTMLSFTRTGLVLLLASLCAGFLSTPKFQLSSSAQGSPFAAAAASSPNAETLKARAKDWMANNGYYAPPKPESEKKRKKKQDDTRHTSV